MHCGAPSQALSKVPSFFKISRSLAPCLKNKKGQIIFEFTVNENGEVKNIKVVRDLGTNSAVELIRVLRKAPKWQPATRGGKPVSINLKMPLTFK